MQQKNKTLIEALLEAGYPREEIYHHCSDLYIYITPTTTAVVNSWFEKSKLNKLVFVSTFKDLITGRPMYDIAFQYYEKSQEEEIQ